MTVLNNNELLVRNAEPEDWPGFGVGMLRRARTGSAGQLLPPELEVIDSRVVFLAGKPRCEYPFSAASDSANVPALTLRANAIVVNGPQPIRAGEVGRVFRGSIVRALAGDLGNNPFNMSFGPAHADWTIQGLGHGWSLLGKTPVATSILSDVCYFAPGSHPPTGLIVRAPSSGMSGAGSAYCSLLRWTGKYDAAGYEESLVDVFCHNVQSGDIEANRILQAKFDTIGERYIIDVEDCPGV